MEENYGGSVKKKIKNEYFFILNVCGFLANISVEILKCVQSCARFKGKAGKLERLCHLLDDGSNTPRIVSTVMSVIMV